LSTKEDSIPADNAGEAANSVLLVFEMSKLLGVEKGFLSISEVSEDFLPPNHQLKNVFVSNMTFPSLDPPPPKVLCVKSESWIFEIIFETENRKRKRINIGRLTATMFKLNSLWLNVISDDVETDWIRPERARIMEFFLRTFLENKLPMGL
jgi:hypothetical protein